MKKPKQSERETRGRVRCSAWLDRTAIETNSINPKPPVGLVCHVRDSHVLKDQLNRMLQVVNGVLDAVSPSIGTARELRDGELEVCKLGLSVLKLTLQSLDSLCVSHGGDVARSNDPSSATAADSEGGLQ
jgi:hypothetical protein